MTLNTSLIQARERLLARVMGFSPESVLNLGHSERIPKDGLALVAQLKQTSHEIKALAIDSDGRSVSYLDLAKSDIYGDFKTNLTPQLQYFDPTTLNTHDEKLAFWINLYNVLVINGVICFEVKTSITKGFIGILRFFRQAAYNIGGYRTSLDDIEHGILRGNRGNPFIPGSQFGSADPRQAWVVHPIDPRMHFGLNCASKSCPPIGVYSSEKIDSQLDTAAHNFINQEVSFEPETNTIKLSRIFQWFSVDFGGKDGVLDFIARYLPEGQRHLMIANRHRLRLKYTPYDWSLNSR